MKLRSTKKFVRKLEILVRNQKNLGREVGEVIQLLINDPQNPGLRLHKLEDGLNKYSSVSVKEDLRIVFYYSGDGIVLMNIGTHQEVYEEN